MSTNGVNKFLLGAVVEESGVVKYKLKVAASTFLCGHWSDAVRIYCLAVMTLSHHFQ